MSLDPGAVVWHEAPFKPSRSDGTSPDRPWLVVSNASHPFHGEEYVVLGMTTNPRAEGIRVTDADWADGGTPKTSYVSPWFAMTLKHADVEYRIGSLDGDLVERAVSALTAHLGP